MPPALVLAHQIHFPETRPAIAFELSKFIKLQHPVRGKQLYPFLGKCLAVIGQIMDCFKRTVRESNLVGANLVFALDCLNGNNEKLFLDSPLVTTCGI